MKEEQLEIDGLPPKPKKRGRKPDNPNLGAKDAASRKRDQLARQWERINTEDCENWTEADCLLVLASAKYDRGTALDKGAWQRLGQLRGYV